MEQSIVIEVDDEENRAWTMASAKHSERETHMRTVCMLAYEWEVHIGRDVNVRISFSADEKRTIRVTLKFNNWIDASIWAREMSDTQNQLHGIGFYVIFNRILQVLCVAWHCLLVHTAITHSIVCLFICFVVVVLPARHQKIELRIDTTAMNTMEAFT